MSLPPYASYKLSEADWLEAIPDHWNEVRVRNLFEIKKRIVGELGYDVLAITQQGVKVKDLEASTGQFSMDYTKYQLVEVGDFAMNHMDLLTGYVDISAFRGVTSPDYRVFSVLPDVDLCSRFFLYVFQHCYRQKIFFAYGQGSAQLGRWRFPTDEFKNFRLPFPTPTEQEAIVAFLDRETAKIDALVAEQERLIALLKEKRQAVISHAVTRGLDPTVPMKDSGIDWLGEVPSHWSVSPLKYLVRFHSGGTPAKDRVDFWDGDVPWASAKDLKHFELLDTADHITDAAIQQGSAKTIPANTVVVVVRGMILARTFPVAITRTDMAINQDLKALTPFASISPEYMARYLCGTEAESLARLDEAGHGTKALRMDKWTDLEVCVPPIAEQHTIIAGIQDRTSEIDKLTREAEAAISLLKERRAALISAAVTGQIDVRGLVDEEAAA